MHSFAPEILLITILGLVVLSDAVASRLKIPSVFLLLIGSYTIYNYVPMAVPLDLKSSFDTIIQDNDRVALIPPGTPGPYRVLLGFKNKKL